MQITLKLYAHLTELLPAHAKHNMATVEVADNASLNMVIDQFRVPHESAHLVLLNGVFVCHEDRNQTGRLKEGDALAIWPPVAGG